MKASLQSSFVREFRERFGVGTRLKNEDFVLEPRFFGRANPHATLLLIALYGSGAGNDASHRGESRARAYQRERANTVLKLYDIVGIGSQTSSMVKREVERVYAQARISLTWSDTRTDGPRPEDVIIRIYIVRELPQSVRRGSKRVMGLALSPSNNRYDYIYVARSEVERTLTAFPGNVPPNRLFLSRALGRVIAHELAHLLLRTREHTEHGLLKRSLGSSDLRARDTKNLYLSPQQVAAIRRNYLRVAAR